MRRSGVHEIDSSIEVSMQLAQLTKQVALLATQSIPNKEKYGVCSTLGFGVDNYPYKEKLL